MNNDATPTFALPSALVLSSLLADHAGDAPFEALERAGFARHEIGTYLQRRAARPRCSNESKSGC
jgi:hypothetical protein